MYIKKTINSAGLLMLALVRNQKFPSLLVYLFFLRTMVPFDSSLFDFRGLETFPFYLRKV
jgi:hypothetical protein